MIYIVGGNGFVGSAIARQCEYQNHEYVIVTRDNAEQLYGSHCDLLINANGNSKKYMAEREPIWEFDASVRSVHEYLVHIQADKYVQLSSCDVYPNCSDYAGTAEDKPIDITAQSAYGFHKYMAELCVRYYAQKWLIFRMGGFVGPGLKKNAIYDILHNAPLWLDEKSKLQFISTDAAAKIILDLALSEYVNEVFNLCGDGTVCLRDIIDETSYSGEKKSGTSEVLYEVNVDKIKRIVSLEKSCDAVFNYINNEMRG